MKWLGILDINDWTREDTGELYEDIPEEVESFLKSSSKKKLFKMVRAAFGLNAP